jgi:cell wall-associated NlpC family hydrolase
VIGALILAALLFYALLYSGIANLRGDPTSTWDALTGAVPAGGLTGPVATVPIPTGGVTGANPVGAAVVAACRAWIGRGYLFGGTGANGGPVDCSGLIDHGYLVATGRKLPHSSAALIAGCVRISASSASAGDLIFWPGHIALYTGGGMMLESAPSHHGVAEVAVSYQRALGKPLYGRPRFLVDTGHVGSGPGR